MLDKEIKEENAYIIHIWKHRAGLANNVTTCRDSPMEYKVIFL